MTHNICPKCHFEATFVEPVIHHFLCAYVGPTSDFAAYDDGACCPKCSHKISKTSDDWEPIGFSLTCRSCGHQSIASIEAVASYEQG